MLTKDQAWISRPDLVHRFQDVYEALPSGQLRAQVDAHFMKQLSREPTPKERRQAAERTIEKFPQVLQYYMRQKEDTSKEAHAASGKRVEETEEQFIRQLRWFVSTHLLGTEFYESGDSYTEALKRVRFLKKVIEDKDGYRLFYLKGKPIHREADLQIMYRLTWFATPLDVNREVNNGRGPVDFKVSSGAVNAALVEFKLASNPKLRQNLQHQVEVYKSANDTGRAIKAILYFNEAEYIKVKSILEELKIENREDVVLIDARNDNKPSGSNAA
jgi:hypothetical protein